MLERNEARTTNTNNFQAGQRAQTVTENVSLFKEIPIHERIHVQFRAEVFNLLNHPQFDNPNTVIGSPQAGVISNQVNSSRDIQLALKLLF